MCVKKMKKKIEWEKNKYKNEKNIWKKNKRNDEWKKIDE